MTLSTGGKIFQVNPEGSGTTSNSAPSLDAVTFSPHGPSDVDDLWMRFLTVRSVAGSPLRDDLDLCLLELDALLAAVTAIMPALTYMQFEMETHRSNIIEALQSGYEL